MKIFQKAFIIILLSSAFASAQRTPRVSAGIDVGTGYQDGNWVPAVTYHQELSLNNFRWFRIGWGLRAWGYYGGKANLLPQTNTSSKDTLKIGKITANGASLLFGANFRLWRFDIGANTDIVGIAFGLKRKALYSKNYIFTSDDAGYYNKLVPSTPAFLNVLPLALDKQNGQSELYIRYWVNDRIGIKLGYTHGRITYLTSEKLDNKQNRFSHTYGVPFVALSFPINN
jgi:hypothetical protein